MQVRGLETISDQVIGQMPQGTLLSKIKVLVIGKVTFCTAKGNGSCDICMIQSFEGVQLVANVPSGDPKNDMSWP